MVSPFPVNNANWRDLRPPSRFAGSFAGRSPPVILRHERGDEIQSRLCIDSKLVVHADTRSYTEGYNRPDYECVVIKDRSTGITEASATGSAARIVRELGTTAGTRVVTIEFNQSRCSLVARTRASSSKRTYVRSFAFPNSSVQWPFAIR